LPLADPELLLPGAPDEPWLLPLPRLLCGLELLEPELLFPLVPWELWP
jgi:hypothetical protein